MGYLICELFFKSGSIDQKFFVAEKFNGGSSLVFCFKRNINVPVSGQMQYRLWTRLIFMMSL